MAKIFVSYSHDSKAHIDRVSDLVLRLRSDGVDVTFDQDMIPQGGPYEGWQIWSEFQVQDANRVLIVCTERYCARYNHKETPGVGAGATWEAAAIRQLLGNAGRINECFRCVVLAQTDERHVPLSLQAYHRYSLYKPAAYNELLVWLTGRPAAAATPFIQLDKQISWPRPDAPYEWDTADRHDIFQLFGQIITGTSPRRILLVSAGGNGGKTHVMRELRTYARHLGTYRALIDLKGGLSFSGIFDSLRTYLSPAVLRQSFNAKGTARFTYLIEDLRCITSPVLLIFDTYEQATEEVRRWIENPFLNQLDAAPAVIAVVAGQSVPDHKKAHWKELAQHLELRPIDDPSHWKAYYQRKWKVSPPPDAVEELTKLNKGEPGGISAVLEACFGPQATAGMPTGDFSRVRAATRDSQSLALTNLDIVVSMHGVDLHPVVEAAAILHWFTSETLAQMLGIDKSASQQHVERLRQLPMIESFEARGGWNVHETTRLALRRYLYTYQPNRFRELSAVAAGCFPSDNPHERIESLFHSLSADETEGGSRLRTLYNQWFDAGRPESLLVLAQALGELLTVTPPARTARARCGIYFVRIQRDYLALNDLERIAREALHLSTDTGDLVESFARDTLGMILESQGRLADALSEYRRALEIHERGAMQYPDNADLHHAVSLSHHRIGNIHSDLKQLSDALAEHQAGLKTIQAVVENDRENTTWQRELSFSLNRLGGIYEQLGQPDRALRQYLSALEIDRELARENPTNLPWQRDLSIAHRRIGRIRQLQGRLDEALGEYRESLITLNELTRQDPYNTRWQRDLSTAHRDVGDILVANDQTSEALVEYQSSLRIIERLVQVDPENAQWQRDLSIARNNIERIR